jgi:hypothetical protein
MRAEGGMTQLVLGPLLRYAGTESATFWVETSAPCEVEILGRRTRTFTVDAHHFALLLVDDLEPASITPYDVRLDGVVVWPPDDGRPSPAVRTRAHERQVRLAFGSCRLGGPQPAKLAEEWDETLVQQGVDALWTYSKLLQRGEAEWPDGLLLLGDQVYADEVSPATLEFIRARRDTGKPPGEQIADFEEYTRLYRESWSEPDIRWLLSAVPTAMIFDDHDVNDDWNISWRWVQEMRRKAWWTERIAGAFMAYWVYQHIGNLSPPELDAERTLDVVAGGGDAGPALRSLALEWDRESAASRWAYHRDFGDSRLLVLDSRAARVLAEGRREMVDEEEWRWIVEHSRGEFDHLVLASTLPVFLPGGIHHLEAWNEALCDGRWGRAAAWLSEKLRRAVDLEHWAAFNPSFERLCSWLRDLARGQAAPSTIVILGGDVHNAYVSEVELGGGGSRVFQIVCSPFRNRLTARERRIVQATGSRPAGAVFSRLARKARVPEPSASWRFIRRPTYDNSIGELELDARSARVTLWRSPHRREDVERLVPLHRTELASDPQMTTTGSAGMKEGDPAHART